MIFVCFVLYTFVFQSVEMDWDAENSNIYSRMCFYLQGNEL